MQLVKEGNLKLGSVRHFIIDECDKVLDSMGKHSQPACAHCWLVPFCCRAALSLRR